MANISSASGTCHIIAESLEDCEKLYHILQKSGTSNWKYETWYEEIDDTDTLPDGRHCLNIPFTGAGRWAYLTNIEATFRWLKPVMTEEEWKFVTDTAFSLQYEYIDYEGGCAFLLRDFVTLTHHVGEKPDEVIVSEDIQDSYPYTPFWFFKIVYDGYLDDVLEGEFIFDFIEESEQKELFDVTIKDYMSYYGLDYEEAKKKLLEDSKIFRGTFGGDE